MADGAAHLVEHVLAYVPIRQWVVSFPFELGGALDFQPELLVASERMVMDALCSWPRARGAAGTGGVLVRHRFGGALNPNVHTHVLMLDGGYQRDSTAGLRFEQTTAPNPEDLHESAETIHRRLLVLLKRCGLLKAEDDDRAANDPLDALRACGRVAAHAGRCERAGPAVALAWDDEVEQPKDGIRAVVGGVNVYASRAMEDRETIERVARYLLRGPLSLSRLRMRPDGLLTYRLKKPDRRGNTAACLCQAVCSPPWS